MHSSTIRNYRCGISQGPLYRTVNERGCLKSRLLSRQPVEFKIKSLYYNDLILNVAHKIKEAVQKLKFLDSPYYTLKCCTIAARVYLRYSSMALRNALCSAPINTILSDLPDTGIRLRALLCAYTVRRSVFLLFCSMNQPYRIIHRQSYRKLHFLSL